MEKKHNREIETSRGKFHKGEGETEREGKTETQKRVRQRERNGHRTEKQTYRHRERHRDSNRDKGRDRDRESSGCQETGTGQSESPGARGSVGDGWGYTGPVG